MCANVHAKPRICKILGAIALILFFAPQASAIEGPMNTMQSKAVQTQTVRALQSINQGRWETGRDIIAATKDPLSAKIYLWLEFTKRKDIRNYGRLAQFIRKNPEWPLMSSLKRKAEEDMPMELGPAEILAWFDDYPPKTADGVNRYVAALIQTGKTTQARDFLSDWWATTSMSRDNQRELFRKYKGYLSREAHMRRFDAMLLSGEYTNARAIASVLENGYPQLAEARIALAQEAGNANALIAAVPGNLQNDAGLLYERLKWRRKNNLDTAAMEILHKMPPADKILNPDEWWRERHILIRRLLERKLYKSAYLLAAGHQQTEGFSFAQAEWLAGWMALRFMSNETEAYKRFSNLYRNVSSPVSKARGAYWAARAAENFSDKSLSITSYKIAAGFPTVFYGQLAAVKVGQGGRLPTGAPPNLSSAEQKAFNEKELIQAAILFNSAGMYQESGWFLKAFVNDNKTAKGYRFAADLAVELNQLKTAVELSKSATKEGLFLTAQAYPMIVNRLGGISLEGSLVHGIIRQESQFDFQAKSPAGALGLMQLMPATAIETARKMGISHSTSQLTTDPNHNIRLGSEYLSRMIARFGGSYPLAIAAYNAGPGRVDKWLEIFGDPRTGEVDLVDWIELIPIYETRNYVQRVLEATYVYRLRLKGQQAEPTAKLHTDATLR